jgi:hypothetical protein
MKYKKRVLLLTLAAASHLHGSDHTGDGLANNPALMSLQEDEGRIADVDNSHVKLQTVLPLGTSNVGDYALRKIRELLNIYQPGLVDISDFELYEKFLSVLELNGIGIDNIKALKMAQIEAIAREVVSLIGVEQLESIENMYIQPSVEQLTAIESVAPQPSVKLKDVDFDLDAFGFYQQMNKPRQNLEKNRFFSDDSGAGQSFTQEDLADVNLVDLEEYLFSEFDYSYEELSEQDLEAKKQAAVAASRSRFGDAVADISTVGSYLDTKKEITDVYSVPRSTPKFKSAINPMFAHRVGMKKAS